MHTGDLNIVSPCDEVYPDHVLRYETDTSPPIFAKYHTGLLKNKLTSTTNAIPYMW